MVWLQIDGEAWIRLACLLLNYHMRVCQNEPILLDDRTGAAATPLAAVGIPDDHHDGWRRALVDLAWRQISRQADARPHSQECHHDDQQHSWHHAVPSHTSH